MPRAAKKAVRRARPNRIIKTLARKRAAAARRLREYGVSAQLYEQVLEYQHGGCAMCRQPVEPGKPSLAVDHRHSDGLLRGLLCWKCNRAIGAFQRFHPECIDLFEAAAIYLRNPPFTVVSKRELFTAPGKVGTKKRAKLLALLKRPRS